MPAIFKKERPSSKTTSRDLPSQWEQRFSRMAHKRENWVIIPVTIVLVIILLYTIGSALNLGDKEPQLSAYSEGWNDISSLRTRCQAWGYNTSSIVSTPLVLGSFEDPGAAVLLIIGVEEEYLDSERDAIARFLDDGGSVIIADDFGYGESVADLGGGGSKVSFTGAQVFDESYIKNPKFVSAEVKRSDLIGMYGFRSDLLGTYDGDDGSSLQLLFNEPSALKIERYASNVNVIAQSSPYSWRDDNDNGERDLDEPVESHPLIVSTGGNRLWYVSDPGLFVNDFIDRLDNSLFIQELIDFLLPDDGEVIFEESRHISDDIISNSHTTFYEMVVVITSDFWLYISLLLILVVIFGVIRYRVPKQELWRDVNSLHHPNTNTLSYPWLTHYDHQWVRSVFLERVRLSMGASHGEFHRMTPFQVQEFIGDRELMDFCFNPYAAHYHDLNRLIDAIEKWEPHEKADVPPEATRTILWDDDDLPMLKEEDVLFQVDATRLDAYATSSEPSPQGSIRHDETEQSRSLGGPFQNGWEWETPSTRSDQKTPGDLPVFREDGEEEF